MTCFFLFPSSLLDLDQLARPSYQAELRSAPQHGYPLGMGSDVETETEGGPSPDHALRLWMQEIKSEHSSCLSSRANSVLSLTDTEQERKSDGENGKTTWHGNCNTMGLYTIYLHIPLSVCSYHFIKRYKTRIHFLFITC